MTFEQRQQYIETIKLKWEAGEISEKEAIEAITDFLFELRMEGEDEC